MGKGDKKTKKGKIFMGSFGKSRPAKVKKAAKKKSQLKDKNEHIKVLTVENTFIYYLFTII